MSERARASIPDRWRTRWLVPAVTVGLGGVILAAEATDGDLTSGLVWFAVLAALGALHAFGGRFAAVRQARGEEDEREAMINTRAMALAGTVLVIVLTGCIVFELARGESPSPYTQLMAVGGATYAAALLVLRWRS
jgi:drug/metabolite transporter (DMT)-like permease